MFVLIKVQIYTNKQESQAEWYIPSDLNLIDQLKSAFTESLIYHKLTEIDSINSPENKNKFMKFYLNFTASVV